jgi:hypothetical protein
MQRSNRSNNDTTAEIKNGLSSQEKRWTNQGDQPLYIVYLKNEAVKCLNISLIHIGERNRR